MCHVAHCNSAGLRCSTWNICIGGRTGAGGGRGSGEFSESGRADGNVPRGTLRLGAG
jgi:hypothetical protein